METLQITEGIPQLSVLGKAIRSRLLTAPDVIEDKNGTRVTVLEVSPKELIRANQLSDFFNGQLPEDIRQDKEARIVLSSGLEEASIEVSVFADIEFPRVDTWKVVLGSHAETEVLFKRGDMSGDKNSYKSEYDETLRLILEKTHTPDIDVLEYAAMLEDIAIEEEWSQQDTREIQNALMMAELHHKVKNKNGKLVPQRRQSGELYITHPWEVMQELRRAGLNNPDVLKAALIHDIAEDSTTLKQPRIDKKTGELPSQSYPEWFQERLDELSVVVGPVAAMYAMLMTRPRPDGRAIVFLPGSLSISSITILTEEDAEERYRSNLEQYSVVLLIKMADRLHNIKTLGSMPPENQRKTILSTIEHYFPTFEVARERYPEETNYFIYQILNAMRPVALRIGIDIDML